jgi:hypothetical protein
LIEIRVDTIVLHDTFWRVREVVRFQEKEVFPIKKEDIAKISPILSNSEVISEMQIDEVVAPTIGTSLGDSPELLEFFNRREK